jgi:hypothetical protein
MAVHQRKRLRSRSAIKRLRDETYGGTVIDNSSMPQENRLG